MDDRQVLETALTGEHLDIHPLDEALAIRRLVKDHAMTVVDVAAKLGRSSQYVYQHLRLCDLVPEARVLFRKGRLNVQSALYVARVPSVDLQKELVREISKWPDLTPAAVAHLVQSKYMLRLEIAPFDVASETIVPAAGSCSRCPKRTGNQRELFTDVKSPDVCTDPACYKGKADASWKGHETLALARGWKVLSKADCAKLFTSPGADLLDAAEYNTPYVSVESKCSADPKGRTWKQLLGRAEVQFYLGRDPAMGRIHHLVRRKEAVEAGLVNGHTFLRPATEDKGPDPKAELRKRVVVRVLQEIYAVSNSSLVMPLVDALARILIERGAGDSMARRFLADRGEKLPKGKTPAAWLLGIFKAGEGLGLLPELVLGKGVHDVWAGYDPALKAAARAASIDLKAIEVEVRKGMKGTEKAPKKPKAKGKD
jgi:hypothetical protein